MSAALSCYLGRDRKEHRHEDISDIEFDEGGEKVVEQHRRYSEAQGSK